MQTPDNLFESSRAALGTPQAIAAIESISAFANCTSPHGEYTTEIHSARGGRVRFKQTWANRNPIQVIINSDGAWATDIVTGESDPIDAPSVSMVREHEFQMLPLTLAERYHDAQPAQEIEWNNVSCFQIQARDDMHLPCAHFFRRDDHRWLGMELTNTRHVGNTIRVVVQEWRTVENVLLPSRVSAIDANGEYILDFNDIRLNQASAALFKEPVSPHHDAIAI
jgi:hypothetical protein